MLGGCALVLLAIGVLLLVKKWRCHVPLVLLTVMFGVLCLVSGVMAVPKLGRPEKKPPEPEPVQAQRAPEANQPNVYLFLYDEYSGPEGLTYFYNFDNSPFYEALEQRGFSCSDDSYNTESCSTTVLVPNLYALSYDASPFVSGDGEAPYLYRVFQELGYQVNLVSHNDFLDTDGARVLTKGQTESSICQYLYQNSLLPFTPLSGVMEQQIFSAPMRDLSMTGTADRCRRRTSSTGGIPNTIWDSCNISTAGYSARWIVFCSTIPRR